MHTKTTLTLLFCLTVAVLAKDKYVVWRMDDIQDRWEVPIQKVIMDVFKTRKIPLTVGIIANNFGADPDIVNYIKSAINTPGWDFDIANHGYRHERFTTFDLANQTELLRIGKATTVGVLSPLIDDIKTFIPPENLWNDDTITALKTNGFDIISAGINAYAGGRRPYPGTDSVRHYPMGAATTDLADVYRVSSDETMGNINVQIEEKGFSVVMMHFIEFRINGTGPGLNQSSVDDLVTLIEKVEAAGYKHANIRGYHNICNGGSATTGTAQTTTGTAQTTTGVQTTTTGVQTTTSKTTGVQTTGVKTTTGAAQTTTGAAQTTTGAAQTTTGAAQTTTGAAQTSTGAAKTTGVQTTGVQTTTGVQATTAAQTATTGSSTDGTNNFEDSASSRTPLLAGLIAFLALLCL